MGLKKEGKVNGLFVDLIYNDCMVCGVTWWISQAEYCTQVYS